MSMSQALPGAHYCAKHQGNGSHYAEHNCELRRALGEKQPNIEQILVASTAHLSPSDAELLDRLSKWSPAASTDQREWDAPRVSSHQYGWTLYAGQSRPEEVCQRVEALRRAGASSTLCALYADACTRGVTALHFDRDAKPVPGYDIYDETRRIW